MPVMDGVEATRRIMAESPCAIVIVTVDRKQNVHRVFEAMGHGALDVVDTPHWAPVTHARLRRRCCARSSILAG